MHAREDEKQEKMADDCQFNLRSAYWLGYSTDFEVFNYFISHNKEGIQLDMVYG